MAQTTEKAFETYLESVLLDRGGWRRGDVAERDVGRAIFPRRVIAYLEATQPRPWAEMEKLHGAHLESLRVARGVRRDVYIGAR